MASELKVDTISEVTSANGVAIDGVTLKDNKVTANGGLVADNITIDGTEIDLSSGDLTLDVAGDIILDADGADVSFRDDGTGHLSISNSSNDAVITSLQSDKDMIFKGVDGGSLITALTLDMSAAGKALFNSGAAFSGNVDFADNAKIVVGSGDDLQIYHDGSHNYILGNTSDQDIIFKGNDGGSAITAVTLDMSDAGHATFNNQITSGSHIIIPATSRLYLDGSGDTFISEVAANAIAFTTGNSERVRINSSGNMGVATNSPVSKLSVAGQITATAGATSAPTYAFDNDTNTGMTRPTTDAISFVTGGTEHVRVTSTGRLGIGQTAPDYKFQVDETANSYAANIRNRHGSEPFGTFMKYTSAAPDNSSSQFLVCQDSGTTRMVMHSDGDCYNHDGVFAQISDRRIKQNITDASSQWDDIKAIKVRNFERKDDVRAYGEGEKIQIGVIGQELEAVSPKLVKELEPDFSDILSDSSFGTVYTADDAETQDAVLYTADDQEVIDGNAEVGDIKIKSTKEVNDIKSLTGEKVKGVKYSILYMKAIKALQEAMDRIETLEAKVTTLENN